MVVWVERRERRRCDDERGLERYARILGIPVAHPGAVIEVPERGPAIGSCSELGFEAIKVHFRESVNALVSGVKPWR